MIKQIKDKLLQFHVFQILVKYKMRFKSILQTSKFYEQKYDEKSFYEFEKHIMDPDYIYEKEVEFLPVFIKRGHIVFDIGANRGEYSFYFSRLVGEEGKVFAFEPGKRAFTLISKIKDYYALKNLEILNFALTDQIGNQILIVPYFHRQSQLKSDKPIKGKKESVMTTTFDRFIEGIEIDRIDFIKCDTEGSEYLVFSGAAYSIRKFKPVIQVEIADLHTARFGHTSLDVLELLRGMDYHMYFYDHKIQKLTSIESIQYKPEGHVWSKRSENLDNNNYIFIHSSQIEMFEEHISNNSKSKG